MPRGVGIRQVTGEHLTLYTDLPRRDAIEELPHVFDLAVPQWCRYFGIPLERAADWRWTAYLMGDKALFERVGVLHDGVPSFLHGYQLGDQIWLYEQPSDYYRRHLLLHEGTHGMLEFGCQYSGPPWYVEGVAEMLATHHWDGRELRLHHLPTDKESSSFWGRIKVIRDEVAAGRRLSLAEIMNFDRRAHLRVEPYAWSWAAATFLDAHPETQAAFRALARVPGPRRQFNQQLRAPVGQVWPFLRHQWQHFTAGLDYGYDVVREQVKTRPSAVVGNTPDRLVVRADRGWQSTGWRVEAGVRYEVTATGRCQLNPGPPIWWCEPHGITIRYHGGQPLGAVVGAIVDESQPPTGDSPLLGPIFIGKRLVLRAEGSGTLYVRVNDAPAEIADNAGEIVVGIRREPD